MKTIFNLLLVLSLTVSFASCGGGDSNQSNPDNSTFLRFFNAIPDASGVDLAVNSEPYYTDVGYLEGTGYFRLPSKDQLLQVSIHGSFTSVFDKKTSLSDQNDSSLFVYGPTNDSRSLLIKDDNETPGDQLSKIRVINFSNASKNVDVYIVSAGGGISGEAPAKNSLGYGAISDYLTSRSGPYTITVTPVDSQRILSRSRAENFENGSVYTIVLADTAPGSLPPRIIVLKDRGQN